MQVSKHHADAAAAHACCFSILVGGCWSILPVSLDVWPVSVDGLLGPIVYRPLQSLIAAAPAELSVLQGGLAVSRGRACCTLSFASTERHCAEVY